MVTTAKETTKEDVGWHKEARHSRSVSFVAFDDLQITQAHFFSFTVFVTNLFYVDCGYYLI